MTWYSLLAYTHTQCLHAYMKRINDEQLKRSQKTKNEKEMGMWKISRWTYLCWAVLGCAVLGCAGLCCMCFAAVMRQNVLSFRFILALDIVSLFSSSLVLHFSLRLPNSKDGRKRKHPKKFFLSACMEPIAFIFFIRRFYQFLYVPFSCSFFFFLCFIFILRFVMTTTTSLCSAAAYRDHTFCRLFVVCRHFFAASKRNVHRKELKAWLGFDATLCVVWETHLDGTHFYIYQEQEYI